MTVGERIVFYLTVIALIILYILLFSKGVI